MTLQRIPQARRKNGRFKKSKPRRSFLDLPAEIRHMIYELCLVADRTIRPFVVEYETDDGVVPYSKWPKDDKIATSLLFTNRLIYEESKLVLFSKNTWFLSGRYYEHWNPAFCGRWGNTSQLWDRNIKLFRSVEVALDWRDTEDKCRRLVMETVYRAARRSPQYQDYSEARSRHIHSLLLSTIFLIWITKLRLIRMMSLSNLTVHLSTCYCPQTCCRLEKFALSDPSLLGVWQRFGTPEIADNPHVPNSLRRDTYVRQDAARAWGDTTGTPQNLQNMRIQVVSDKDFAPNAIQELVHQLGLGCKLCPLVDGRQRPETCDFHSE